MNKKELGIYIKKRRLKFNITQIDIANSLNISTQAISKWENGISYPDFIILGELANLLKVSIDDLLNLEDSSSIYNETRKFNYLTFGQTINKYLEYYNLTQQDLANKTGINQSSISNIINGKSYPTIDQFINITNYLNTSYSDLYYSIFKEKKSENSSKKKNIKIFTICSLTSIIILTTLGIFFNNKDNDNNNITNNYNAAFIDEKYYPHVEFWDEYGNLIDAQRIPHNKKIEYYPETITIKGWNKEITNATTSTIYQANKNPYKYYFFIYSDKGSFYEGYDSLEDFSNFQLFGVHYYLKDIFKDAEGNVIDIYSLPPGVYTLYGETTPIETHTISFPTSLNIEPIEIRDAEKIPELPLFANENQLIKGYQYNNQELIVAKEYSFEQSIDVAPIYHNQTTHIDQNGIITYLNTNEEVIIIPDSINNIKVKGISSNAIHLNNNNNKILFLNKNKITCQNIFNNIQLINNIKTIEFKYNFITNESYLGNISNIDDFIVYQNLDYHEYYSQYSLNNISTNNNFHINNLYYDDNASEVVNFKNLNVDDVYFNCNISYANLGSDYMFENSSIKRFHLNSKIIDYINIDIMDGFFYNCKNLETFDVPRNTKISGENHFYGCTNLKEVTFYGNVDILANNMFNDTKIKEVTINNVEIIKENAFINSVIEKINIVNIEHIENRCYLPSTLNDFYLGGRFEEPIKFSNLNNSLKIHYIDYNVFEIDKVKNNEYRTCVNCLCRHKGEKNDYWILN